MEVDLSRNISLGFGYFSVQNIAVDTDLGRVEGLALPGNGAAFRGIPFAQAPVGNLRWRDAVPATPWADTLDATCFGAACPQPVLDRSKTLPQNEDCLTLNIVTPNVEGEGLPVLFSIHGGAYAIGSGRYIADRDLSPIVRRGVVLVSANYRLGRFGFFAHPALTAEAGRGVGNFWLTDQLEALRWVQRNIARFGGDPANVTILGCSAGGSSVNSLVTSDSARGLFAKAAAHSAGGLFNAARPLAVAEQEGVAFARRAGFADGDLAILDKLRGLTAEQILAADPWAPDFGAIVDGCLIRQPAGIGFATDVRSPVPMIIGSTSNEASIFDMMGFDVRALKCRFDIDIEELRHIYESAGPLSDAEMLRRVQTDFIFTAASLTMASFAARHAPTFSYHFDYVPAAQREIKPGASHCADMSYTFLDDARRTAEDDLVAERQQSYWYNFIAHGDPNGENLLRWLPVTPGNVSTLLIGAEPSIVSGLHRERIAYWRDRWARQAGLAIDA